MTMIERFQPTLGNEQWLRSNLAKIHSFFPESWEPMSVERVLPFAFWLKLQGCDWRETTELAQILSWISKLGIVEVDMKTQQFRRSVVNRN